MRSFSIRLVPTRRCYHGRRASDACGRPIGCWAPAKENLAIEQTSGRQRLNVHGALDLETGETAMIDVETVDAASTIRVLQRIEAMYPVLAMIHVFLDNARYHPAALVQEWLALSG